MNYECGALSLYRGVKKGYAFHRLRHKTDLDITVILQNIFTRKNTAGCYWSAGEVSSWVVLNVATQRNKGRKGKFRYMTSASGISRSNE